MHADQTGRKWIWLVFFDLFERGKDIVDSQYLITFTIKVNEFRAEPTSLFQYEVVFGKKLFQEVEFFL